MLASFPFPGYSQSDRSKKLCTRLDQVQKWLGFSDACLDAWQKLGVGFLTWLIQQTKARNIPNDQVRHKKKTKHSN